MMAAHISSVVTDNRAQAIFMVDSALNRTTLNTSSIQMYTTGADQRFGTADDVRVKIGIFWNAAQNKITTKVADPSKFAADTPFRLRLQGSKIKTLTGTSLDGEYRGASARSGNGNAGGNYDIISSAVTTGDPTARITTTDGTMNVKLYASNASVRATVDNFLLYADNAIWDSTFFHRKTTMAGDSLGVVQAGGFGIEGNLLNFRPSTQNGITLQAGLSNTIGTIAMARTGDPNSGKNQWFINYVDNSAALDKTAQSDGYAVFGKVTTSSMAILQKLAAHQMAEIHADPNVPTAIKDQISGQTGVDGQGNATYKESLPVRSKAKLQARGSVLNPAVDLIKVTRVAIVNKIQKMA